MIELPSVAALALKTSVLFVVTGLACALLAHKSAAHRHFLWSAALALSLLLPLASAALPSWGLIPAFWQSSPLPAAGAGVNETTSFLQAVIWPCIVTVWSVGALLLLFRDLLANIGLARWVRQAKPLRSVRWIATLRAIPRELVSGSELRVFESAQVASPCTWGLARPVLLLPLAGVDWQESQRRDALLHELAHIHRLDYLSSLAARLACALHWYNPFVWWAAAQARRLQEQACDDAVLRAGGRPSEYAQFLLDVAEGNRQECGSLRIAMAMLRRSALHARVLAILDPHRARVQPDRCSVLAALVPLCCLTVVLAAAATVPQVQVEQLPAPAAIAAPASKSAAAAPAAASTEAQPATRVRPTQATTEDSAAPAEGRPRQPLLPPPPLEPLKPLPPLEPIPPVPPVPPVPRVPPDAPVSRAHDDFRPLEAQ